MDEVGSILSEWRYPLAFLAVIALGVLLRRFLAFQNLLKLRVRPFGYRVVAADEIPVWLPETLEPALRELSNLGLAPAAWLEVTPIVDLEPSRYPALLLRDGNGASWAVLSMASVPEPAAAISVELFSFRSDGRCLFSTNGWSHSIVGDLPDTDVDDPYAETLAELWTSHQTKLGAGAAALALERDEMVRRVNEGFARYLEALIAKGAVKPGEAPERWALTARAAWAMSARAVASASRMQRLLARRMARMRMRARAIARGELSPLRGGNAYTDTEVPAGVEASAFLRGEDLTRRPSRRGLAGWALALTAIAFVLSFAHLVEPLRLALLVAAVTFHELGHLVAMRLRGYRDTSIFFIPFFGAAATGRKQDATLADELIVLLAGPVPGLLAALALAAAPLGAPRAAGLDEAIVLLIGLNGFNLLPVPPLDGGRVVQALLASRAPAVDLVFRLFAAGALLMLGLAADSVVLQALAVLQGTAIPGALREARLGNEVRAEIARLGVLPTSPAALVFRVLNAHGGRLLPFNRKSQLVRPVYRRLLTPPPTRGASAAGWFAYVAAWVVVVVALVLFVRTAPADSRGGGSAPPRLEETPSALDAHFLRERRTHVW
ncbi:MAG: hypothetical protein U0610_11835 [bacterium]